MSFKRYRIIFILIFMLTSDGTHNVIMANDIETASNIQQQHTLPNELENAQSGKFVYLSFRQSTTSNLARTYSRTDNNTILKHKKVNGND